jgi:hypothetical protein
VPARPLACRWQYRASSPAREIVLRAGARVDLEADRKEEAAAVRAVFDPGGEFTTAVESLERFSGITDTP